MTERMQLGITPKYLIFDMAFNSEKEISEDFRNQLVKLKY